MKLLFLVMAIFQINFALAQRKPHDSYELKFRHEYIINIPYTNENIHIRFPLNNESIEDARKKDAHMVVRQIDWDGGVNKSYEMKSLIFYSYNGLPVLTPHIAGVHVTLEGGYEIDLVVTDVLHSQCRLTSNHPEINYPIGLDVNCALVVQRF